MPILQLQVRVPILLLLLAAATEHHELMMMVAGAEQPQSITLEGCLDKCGDTRIPFPFGMTPGCFRPGFKVVCNHSFLPPRAFLDGTSQMDRTVVLNQTADIISLKAWPHEVELMDVSVDKSEARVYAAVSSLCITTDKHAVAKLQETDLGKQGPFLVSVIRNVLVCVGARVKAIMVSTFGEGQTTTDYTPSCSSDLMNNLQFATNGSCSGLGCSMSIVPREAPPLASFGIGFENRRNSSTGETTPCSYGMVVETSQYNFSTPDLSGYEGLSGRLSRGVPVALDFAIRSSGGSSSSCPAEGRKPPADYACVSGNSSCDNAAGGGYVCRCWLHYHGNPYIANGCQDIDECEMRKKSNELSLMYPCFGICKNRVRGYDCRCKRGMKGDAKKGNCSQMFPLVATVILGIAASVVICMIIVMSRQHLKLKRFYDQNGGPVLKGVKNIRIYRRKQLRKIANNYKHVIGEGHFGKVYMGTLENKQQVAIKIAVKIDKEMKKEFTDEVRIQSEMRHKNIVRLLGCCLEVDVPVLIYEYVARGSLYDVLFGLRRIDLISVDTRLGIAIGSAEGLAYMHSEMESTLRHGDVKSANILLDQNFTPKVSDFGTTRLLARGIAEMTDHVIGDLSYIDPVYMEHGVVTQKSDVYSFGVILIELITRTPAIYDEDRRYVANFVQASLDKQARSFIDMDITSETDITLLEMVGEVAVECLKTNIEDRLDMKKVEQRLNQIIGQSAQYGQKANYKADLSPAPDDIPMLKNYENEES